MTPETPTLRLRVNACQRSLFGDECPILRDNRAMAAPGFCGTASAVATRGVISTAMACVGAVVGFALWVGTTVALVPLLSFMALGTGPFVAALIGAVFLRRSVSRPCGAPEWAQRSKAAFWVGAILSLTYVCVGMTVEAPQLILFWPSG